MRSPQERAFWTALAVALVVAVAAAWWMADHYGWSQAEPWAEHVWRKITRPGPETLPQHNATQRAQSPQGSASAPAARPRKCVREGSITYTDQRCPPGSQEQLLEGGAVTSLPQ